MHKKNTKKEKVHGNSGLTNTGNTCYMNAALQCISHTYLFRHPLFTNFDKIIVDLLKNAPKIYKNSNVLSNSLREKVLNENYDYQYLTDDEKTFLLNGTMTFQVAKLLRGMWSRNCTVNPISFRKIFTENYEMFHNREQQDSEEAYTCIIQKIQEEMGTEKKINFKTTNPRVDELLKIRYKTIEMINNVDNIDSLSDEEKLEEKKKINNKFKEIKKKMPIESMIIESYREMGKYLGKNYSRVTEIFYSFTVSTIRCPTEDCGFVGCKFEPNLHLQLPLPSLLSMATARNPVQGEPKSGLALTGKSSLRMNLSEGLALTGNPVQGEPKSGLALTGNPVQGEPKSGLALTGNPVQGEPKSGLALRVILSKVNLSQD